MHRAANNDANNQANIRLRHGVGPIPANRPNDHADHLLTQAIKHGAANDMLQLINDAIALGANIQYSNATGRSTLEIAIAANNLPAVQTLFAKGALLPFARADGKDLLMLAAKNGGAGIIAHLLKVENMEPLYTDQLGQTALMYAVKHEQLQAATVLVQNYVDVNASTFHAAHDKGDVIFGFDTDYSGEDVTALMVAVATGNKPMVELLLEWDADVNCGTHDFPLSIAAQSDEPALVQCLLAKNPNTRRHNKEGLTPLHLAIKNDASHACIAALLEQTDIEVRTDTRGCLTPLALAISLQNIGVAAMLIEKKASLQALSNPGVTAWALLPSQPNVHAGMIDLLIYANGPAVFPLPDDAAALFDQLITLRSCVLHQHKSGLFTKLATAIEPLLAEVLNNLRDVPRHSASQGMQRQMRLAYAIASAEALKALGSLDAANPEAADSPAAACLVRVSNASIVQAKQLTSAAQQRLSTICLDFLSAPGKALHTKLAEPDDVSDASAAQLARLLQQEIGLPPGLADHIAHCWRDAVALSLDIFESALDRSEQQRYLQKLLPLLLASDLLPGKYALPGSFETRLTDTLIEGAADAKATLNAFLSDPPKVLRAIEQRHSLRDVNRESLATALYLQAGLPRGSVTAVVDAWADSVTTVKKMPGISSTAQLHAALATQFAAALSHHMGMVPDAKSEYLQALEAEVMTGLSEWCGLHQPLILAPALQAPSDRNSSNGINKRSGPDNPEPDSANKRQRSH